MGFEVKFRDLFFLWNVYSVLQYVFVTLELCTGNLFWSLLDVIFYWESSWYKEVFSEFPALAVCSFGNKWRFFSSI